MRDYLSLTPKKPELMHNTRAGEGGKKKKPQPRKYEGSALQKKHNEELVRLFGARILTMTADEYIRSVPPKKRNDVRVHIYNVMSRQVDEALAYTDGVGHSDESEAPDYLAYHRPGEKDAVQYGVLGMKWGRRRSDAAIAAAEVSRAKAGEPVTPTAKRSDGPESSHERYARIAAVAKGGGAKALSDDDLKFFNARTEAVKKVDKMFEEKPSWLRSTSEDVVRAVAKQQMQAVLSAVATKAISARVNEAMTQAQANAQKAAIKEGIKKGLEEAAKKAEMSKTSAKIPIGFGPPPKK